MRNNRYYIGIAIALSLTLSSCELINNYRRGEAVVTVAGKSLYAPELAEATSAALSAEDSASLADAYIRQWVTETALYEKAKQHADKPQQIEKQVENYRRSLYVKAYEKQLVDNKMQKIIPEDTLQQYYDSHSSYFTLRENIIKGLLIVIPAQAPDREALQSWLGDLNDENMELIEKYAYQNATGYELFTDQWHTQSKILLRIPMERNNMTTLLRDHKIISLSDSTSCYLLRVTDKKMKGETMPYEYARPEIEKLLLEKRQQAFLKEEKEKIYQEAVK